MILDILKDTLLDTIKLIPFLFVAFLIIELIEHKMSDKNEKILKKAGRFGPVLGGVLGAIPQCGFSVLASNLYVTRIISLGTLISIYLSTSDEMLPILLSNGTAISKVIIILLINQEESELVPLFFLVSIPIALGRPLITAWVDVGI